jgi:4-carboxymuconolactone decarboxylase
MTKGAGLPPLPIEQWSDEARTVLPRFLRRPELYLSGTPDDRPMPQALGMFAHHVELGAAWMTFTEMLAGPRSRLDQAIRELAILRVAWRTRSDYEWMQHIRIGKAAGLTTEQLYAIPDGSRAGIWTPLERSVLDATDQIIDMHGVTADTWDSLSAHLHPDELLELTFAIGGYACFAAVASSVGLEPDPPTEPVDAPELPKRT